MKLSVYLLLSGLIILGLFFVKRPPLPKSSPTPPPAVSSSSDLIKVTSPLPNQLVTGRIDVQGTARGTWFFEASFPYRITDDTGQVLATGSIETSSDWMTTDFIPFSAQIMVPENQTPTGSLILMRSNPSGLPQNDASLVIPLRFF